MCRQEWSLYFVVHSTWSGIGIFHLRDGKIHEEWLQSNMEAKLEAMRAG